MLQFMWSQRVGHDAQTEQQLNISIKLGEKRKYNSQEKRKTLIQATG